VATALKVQVDINYSHAKNGITFHILVQFSVQILTNSRQHTVYTNITRAVTFKVEKSYCKVTVLNTLLQVTY